MQTFYLRHWAMATTGLFNNLEEMGFREMVIVNQTVATSERGWNLIRLELAPQELVGLADHFDVMIQKKDFGILICLDEKGRRFSQR